MVTVDQLQQVVEAGKEFPYVMGAVDDPAIDKQIADYDYFFAKPIVYILNVPKEEAPALSAALARVEGINVHAVIAWTPGNVDIHITNSKASKSHAMVEWLQREGLQSSEVMVAGDSNNDLPLFAHAGLKVAMGNGTNELKERADWIAPSVSEDGLAVAIEKFILSGE